MGSSSSEDEEDEIEIKVDGDDDTTIAAPNVDAMTNAAPIGDDATTAAAPTAAATEIVAEAEKKVEVVVEEQTQQKEEEALPPPPQQQLFDEPQDLTFGFDKEFTSEELREGIQRILPETNAKFRNAYDNILKDVWAVEAWRSLMNEAQKLSIDLVRPLYRLFFKSFPTAGRMWKVFAEQEMKMKHYIQVDFILTHCLASCVDVELWKFYLQFTLQTQYQVHFDAQDDGRASRLQKGREIVQQAYERAIEHVGVSIEASAIWVGYINFLKSNTATDPQAFVSVRKVYQRAVTIPLLNMDTIWKNYDTFEKDIPNNETLYQNFIKLLRPKFEAARAILRRRKPLWDRVQTTRLAAPAAPSSSSKQQQQLGGQLKAWNDLIEFELGNPELLEPFGLRSRVRFLFEACLSCQRFRPEIWYRFAEFEKSLGDSAAASAVYDRAIQALPESELLHFAFADHKELTNGDIEGAKGLYESILRTAPSPLIYINYQRFVRRAYGSQGLDQARLIFKRARKDQRPGVCTHHIFSAAALLEYYTVPDLLPGQTGRQPKEIALNIFELGLRKYMDQVDYVSCYLDFLMHLKEDNNVRSLFEKALQAIPVEKTKPIWDRFLHFERSIAATRDLATIATLEERRDKAFPTTGHHTGSLMRICHRYEYTQLKPTNRDDASFYSMYGLGLRDEAGDGTRTASGGRESDSEGDSEDDNTRRIPGPILPDCIKPLALALPLKEPWKGPEIDAAQLFTALLRARFPPRQKIVADCEELLERLKHLNKKRPAFKDSDEDGADGDGSSGSKSILSKRPAHDVFRSRQQQKLAKLL